MPFIDSKISFKLTKDKKESIKKELGKIIEIIPGKSEDYLMVGFNDDYSLYFGGNKLDKGAFIEVKIFGSCEREHKDKFTAAICKLYEKELGIPGSSIYITIEEVKSWGYDGSLF